MPKIFQLLFLSCFLIFQGCEDDEICIESLSSRLNVSISAQDSNSVFSINNLVVTETTDAATIELLNENASSFKVLLPEDKITATYKIDVSFSSSDPLQTKAPITETLTVSYNASNEYVSKACGFKTKFENINYSTTGTLTINSPKNTINNETETHLILQY